MAKTYYAALRRVIKTIAAYTDGVPTNNTNQTVEYTYDGDSHVLTLQADKPAGAYQRTQFVYGVTTAAGAKSILFARSGSNVFANWAVL